MDTPANFEVETHYASFRPNGQVSLQQAVNLVSDAIAFCGKKKIERLLANVSVRRFHESGKVFDLLQGGSETPPYPNITRPYGAFSKSSTNSFGCDHWTLWSPGMMSVVQPRSLAR